MQWPQRSPGGVEWTERRRAVGFGFSTNQAHTRNQTTKGPGDQGPHDHTAAAGNDDADERKRGINRLAIGHKLALTR